MLKRVLGLMLAGSLGTLLRYGLGTTLARLAWNRPSPTLVVNAAGCLLFGTLWAFLAGGRWLSKDVEIIVLTGFMGAFTTFSSMIFEAGDLLRRARWLNALLGLGVEIVVGLGMLYVGVLVGRLVQRLITG